MKKIVFICPYFGKLPNYFPAVLISMKYNSSIDWLIFTDDHSNYEYPPNVRIEYCSFTKISKLIKEKIDCKIPPSPYKLCDVRPFYGLVFEDYIVDYDFWGHCDFDCLFGDIRRWIGEEILNKYNKVLFLGHMSLYSNNLVMKKHMQRYLSLDQTKELLNVSYPCQLDEVGVINFLASFKESIFDEQDMIADVNCLKYNFQINYSKIKVDHNGVALHSVCDTSKKNMIFLFDKGKITGIWRSDQVDFCRKEYMYVHFQKREIQNKINNDVTSFLLVPNMIINAEEVNEKFYSIVNKTPFVYSGFFRVKYKNLKNKIKRFMHHV